MSMTVQEMIDHLSELDPDAPVRLATQPSWPLAFEVASVGPVEDPYTGEQVGDTVWIVEGGSWYQQPYAPRAAWDRR